MSPPPFEEVVWKSTSRSVVAAFAAEDFAAPPGAETRVPPYGVVAPGLYPISTAWSSTVTWST